MSADRDINRVVRSWLHEERHEDADRVLGAVLDQVDATPQRRSTLWTAWRDSPMNKFVAIGLGAAAVIVALFIGAQIFGSTPPGGPPAETPSPSQASAASDTPGLPDFAEQPVAALDPGPYVFTHVEPLTVTLTVPEGWEKFPPNYIVWSTDGDKATLAVASVDNLYVDPCDETLQLRDPAVGPSVEDLAAALATVPGWEFSAPTAVTVDGFTGQYLEYVSATPSGGCADPLLWRVNGDGSFQPAPTVDDVFRIWILDVDGTRLVLTTASFPAVPDASVAELEEMINTIQIEP